MKHFKYFFATLLGLRPLSAFADGSTPAGEGGASATILMIGAALFFFYFIMWRPEQKRRRQMKQMREQLKVGDKVQAMGIVGSIADIREETIVVSTAGETKIEVLKAAITQVQ